MNVTSPSQARHNVGCDQLAPTASLRLLAPPRAPAHHGHGVPALAARVHCTGRIASASWSHPTLLLLMLLALAGCNAGDGFARVPVTGQVKVNGQPLAAGVIRFIPDKAVAGQ